MAEGKLEVTKANKLVVKYLSKKGAPMTGQIPQGQLSADLASLQEDKRTIGQLSGIEVEFELEGAVLKQIRRKGQAFTAASGSPARPSQRAKGGQQVARHGNRWTKQQQHHHQQQQRSQNVDRSFHNPYNFVPAPPRDGVAGELGDQEPVGHHVLHADRYSGVIRVKLTAATPLLLPDAARAVDVGKDHKSFPVRVDAEGKPYLPPTSIKGMLRAAYEAVTNSRLAVFPGHEDRLADRMPARDGLSLVPARINGDQIELLPGTSSIQATGQPDGPMYAAWLPRYDARTGRESGQHCARYSDDENTLPQHGDEVTCWLVKVQHRSRRFSYWRVDRIFRRDRVIGKCPSTVIQVNGYVCITNRNIDRKHDERVFFTTRKEQILHPLTDELRQQWRELITNYQSIHEDECRHGMLGPPALSNSVWSRHVVGGNQERQLAPGTLCYAAFRNRKVTALYPVMISRRLFACSPASLLPASLRPATSLKELSPADRVFGWVNQEGEGAFKGNVRVGPVICETSADAAVERFGSPGLPLAILGQPKPQQARFYVAASSEGKAQEDGLTKEDAGYDAHKGLRGRKVYPHHVGLPQGHWDNPMEDRTQRSNNGHFQEYRRPDSDKVRDTQNRSIQGWVKPETVFRFDLHVANLSPVELGALLWLLSLPENHFHRFGGGKPLGFGSVRLEIDSANTHLRDGNGWREIYRTLDDAAPAEANREDLIARYKDAVQAAYGTNQPFEQVSFIAAWLRMATGHGDHLPTHYPRARHEGQGQAVPPNPGGLAYEWFVANDRTGRNAGPQVSLPNLEDDAGLPMLDARQD